MKKRKHAVLILRYGVYFEYLLLTTAFYYLSVLQTREGIGAQIVGGGDDGLYYWGAAQIIALGGKPSAVTSLYVPVLGFLVKVFQIRDVYFIRVFNCIGLVLLVEWSINLLKMACRFSGEELHQKQKNRALYYSQGIILLCFLLYVSLAMNLSLSIYRDVWIYLFYTLAVYSSIRIFFLKENFYWIMLIPVIAILGGLRKYALVSFASGVILVFVIKRVQSKALVLLICALVGWGYYAFLFEYKIPVAHLSLKDALGYRALAFEGMGGGSQMNIDLAQPSFLSFLVAYAHSYFGNLLGPLPWQIRSGRLLVMFLLESLPMTFILRFCWIQRKKFTKIQQYVFFHGLVWISFIAITNDNLGTAFRLRPVAWILILTVFASLYGEKMMLRRESKNFFINRKNRSEDKAEESNLSVSKQATIDGIGIHNPRME